MFLLYFDQINAALTSIWHFFKKYSWWAQAFEQ